MKRIFFSTIIIALAGFFTVISVYAQNIPNEFLFIEGTAEKQDHSEFFMTNFKIEAAGSGYTITNTKDQAAFTFKFVISPNLIVDINGNWVPPPPDDNQYVIHISLINNTGDEEILSFDFYYTELAEMYEYTQFIFHRAAVYIPPTGKETIVEVEVEKEVEVIVEGEIDRSWQNKWLYLRFSIDYPISFYSLQPTGLFAEQAVYAMGKDNKPGEINMLDHKIIPQPGFSVGLEAQLLTFLALELNFMLNLGGFTTYTFVNLAGAASLIFNIKTKYFVIQPYGSFMMPINVSDEFKEFPLFAAGGGVQACVRGGRIGSFFFYIDFMYFIGDVYRHNPYTELFPNPPEIHYKRFNIGLGAGYKIGFIDRKPSRKKQAALNKISLSEEEVVE